MQVLVIGSEGQLGNEIKNLAAGENSDSFYFTTLEELDVTNLEKLKGIIEKKNWDFIINCTAYTAVDNAEDEKEKCHAINSKAVEEMGRFSKGIGAKVIHVSTDYVFDGTNYRPYKEIDPVNPGSVYGKTKAEGEKALLSQNPESVIIRTSWLYSGTGSNFFKTMLRLGQEKQNLQVVFDQIGTPTYAEDLAKAILHIVKSVTSGNKEFVAGIYHFSNEGVASWYDFALAIFDMSQMECAVDPVTSGNFPTKAPRPPFSVLDKFKIKSVYGVAVPYWRRGLERCLKSYLQGKA